MFCSCLSIYFSFLSFFFFFFQAEDGIRDHCVTGVQTCALPILLRARPSSPPARRGALRARRRRECPQGSGPCRSRGAPASPAVRACERCLPPPRHRRAAPPPAVRRSTHFGAPTSSAPAPVRPRLAPSLLPVGRRRRRGAPRPGAPLP